MVGSVVYSKEVQKTAVIHEHFRKSIGLRISERKEVYKDEVTQLSVEETEDPLNAGYGRTISHILLTLKTTKWAPKLLNWIQPCTMHSRKSISLSETSFVLNPIRERANALENQTLLPRIFDLES